MTKGKAFKMKKEDAFKILAISTVFSSILFMIEYYNQIPIWELILVTVAAVSGLYIYINSKREKEELILAMLSFTLILIPTIFAKITAPIFGFLMIIIILLCTFHWAK